MRAQIARPKPAAGKALRAPSSVTLLGMICFQKRNLSCGRESVKYRVTVRKTAETVNDHLVRHGVARPLLIGETLDQIERKRLVLAILAMFEGKVQKVSFLSFHGNVETLINGSSGESARNGIG